MSTATIVNVRAVTWGYLNPDCLGMNVNPAKTVVGGESLVVQVPWERWDEYAIRCTQWER